MTSTQVMKFDQTRHPSPDNLGHPYIDFLTFSKTIQPATTHDHLEGQPWDGRVKDSVRPVTGPMGTLPGTNP